MSSFEFKIDVVTFRDIKHRVHVSRYDADPLIQDRLRIASHVDEAQYIGTMSTGAEQDKSGAHYVHPSNKLYTETADDCD